MSKVIATGIKNVSPNIIHHNQTDYVKDRYIGVMDSTLKETQEVRVDSYASLVLSNLTCASITQYYTL